jgi:glycosyltransferase involved in cell wall biosynthesis
MSGSQPPTTAEAPDRLPRVWIFQPAVKHYRLPVWDLLCQRGEDGYQLTVFGPLEIDHADIESRPYLESMPLRKRSVWGREFTQWAGAAGLIRRQRPEVILLTASPAFLGSWSLPRLARRIGAAVIGWSKVNNRAGHSTRLQRSLKRRYFRRFDLFIGYGQSSRDELIDLGYPPEQIRIAQNTIDTRRIFAEHDLIAARGQELRRLAGVSGKRVVLCIGRMVPQKRHADLISAWLDVRDVDPDLVLVFVGQGELFEGLRAAAAEADPQRILFTGAVPEGDDYAWIATADVVVLPGAVGLALNQAMAFAKPVVIADEPGADAELLEHGRTGWRYPRGDLQALAATLRQVLGEPSAAKQMGEAARQAISRRATIEQMVEVIDATIREAIVLAQARRTQVATR